MGQTLRILIPSLFVLILCLLPLLIPPHIHSLLQETLFASLYQPSHLPPTPPNQETKTYILSKNPSVIYMENFISPLEAVELVSLSEDNFRPSPLYADDGSLSHDTSYRSSLTATLPLSPIVKTVEERALSLDFFNPGGGEGREVKVKPLVVQKYGVGKQYKDHYDWFLPHPSLTGNIISTIFIYLSANCTGGGTNFPRLFLSPSPSSSPNPKSSPENDESFGIIPGGNEDSWCQFIDCDRPISDGVTFLPIAGNAIFWQNTNPLLEGLPSTLHAGLPVTSGEKMGLNVWGWMDF